MPPALNGLNVGRYPPQQKKGLKMKRTAFAIVLSLLPVSVTAQVQDFALEETEAYMFARLCPFGDLVTARANLVRVARESDNPFVQQFFVDTIDAIVEKTERESSFLERARICAETVR